MPVTGEFTPTVHVVDLTGDYRATIYAAARKLIADGQAHPLDVIQTVRGGIPSMRARVFYAASWSVGDNQHGLWKKRFQPFPGREDAQEFA